MPEPIAVAYVEIRPEPGSFKSETDSEVRRAFGNDPVQIPAQVETQGLEQAKRDITSELESIDAAANVQLRPDLTTFQQQTREIPVPDQAVTLTPETTGFRTAADQAVREALGTAPVPLPTELEVTGLDQAARDIKSLSGDLRGITSGAGGGVAALPRALEDAATHTDHLATSLSSLPSIANVGASAAGAASDFQAADIAAGRFGSTLNDAATAASGVVDVVNLTRAATRQQMLGTEQATQASGEQAQVLERQAAASDRLADELELTSEHAQALAQALDGLIPTGENTARILDMDADSADRASRAMHKLNVEEEKFLDLKARTRAAQFDPVTFRPVPGSDIGRQVGAFNFAQREFEGTRSRLFDEAFGGERMFDVSDMTEQEKQLSLALLERGDAQDRAAAAAIRDSAAKKTAAVTTSQVARGEEAEAASHLQNAAAIDQETRSTERGGLIRQRARRAAPIGPFRLAGVGLGVGTAVFAAAQAVGALGDALAVSGEEASTFQGKMRNLGSALLSADVVGAFKALTNNTKEYSVEQLRLINQTPQLAEAFREMGEGANLARSAQAALSGLTTTPQFLETALTREELQGDLQGQIKTLERQRDFWIQAESIIRGIGLPQKQMNEALAVINTNTKQVKDKLRQLLGGGGGVAAGGASALSVAQGEGDLARVGRVLEAQRDQAKRDIARLSAGGGDQQRTQQELSAITAKIRANKARLTDLTTQLRDLVADKGALVQSGGGLQAEVSIRALEQAIEAITQENVELQKAAAKLRQQIANSQANAVTLASLKAALAAVNRQIEENTQAIIDEQVQHRQEMAEKAAAPLEEDLLLAQIAGDEQAEIAALQALRDQAQRNADRKGITQQERNAYLAQVKSFNDAIESVQEGIAAEEERHATALKESADKEHQAYLNQIGREEQKILNLRVRAEQNARLGDDIKFQEQLVRFYLRMSRNKKLTAAERAAFRDQFVQATAELAQLRAQERQAAKDDLRAEIDAREDLLQDQVTLAKLDERSIRDDQAALKRLIAFYRKMAHNRKLSRAERRDYLIKQRQAEKDLRDLTETETGKAKDFSAQAFEFLQTLHGFTTTFGDNILPVGSTIGRPDTEPRTFGKATFDALPPTTTTSADDAVRRARGERSPFEHGRGRGGAAAAEAARARGGGQTTFGQMEKLLNRTAKTNALLADIRRGIGHPEARHVRAAARHPTEAGVD